MLVLFITYKICSSILFDADQYIRFLFLLSFAEYTKKVAITILLYHLSLI